MTNSGLLDCHVHMSACTVHVPYSAISSRHVAMATYTATVHSTLRKILPLKRQVQNIHAHTNIALRL
jgi:hypothetical protein